MTLKDINRTSIRVPVDFDVVESVGEKDARFTRVKVWLMHTGVNQNRTAFDKEAIENALPSLSNIPICGFIEEDKEGDKDFTGHKYRIVYDNGEYRRVYIGSAYGVIPERNNAHFEERVCDDGETREFLVVDGIVWNQFEDSADILNRDKIKGHSMELFTGGEDPFDGYLDEDGIFHFTRFAFRAACILGDNAEPAMMNSTIEVVDFSVSDFVKAIQEEINDKYAMFEKAEREPSKEETMETEGGPTMPKVDYTQTMLEQWDEICDLVREAQKMRDAWGDEVPRYYPLDVYENEVIVCDGGDLWHYVGFPFTTEGDKVVIDFEAGKRKKITYSDYEDSDDTTLEGAFDFEAYVAKITESAQAKIEEANAAKDEAVSNYEAAKAEYEELKPKYDAYEKAEQDRIAKAIEDQKKAQFSKYEAALSDDADFTALKEQMADLTVEEIESKCAVMFANKTLNATNYSKADTQQPMSVGVEDDNAIPDGYVYSERYGLIRKSN